MRRRRRRTKERRKEEKGEDKEEKDWQLVTVQLATGSAQRVDGPLAVGHWVMGLS
jgi:predicted alpha/beta-hydrolase family hydrolase